MMTPEACFKSSKDCDGWNISIRAPCCRSNSRASSYSVKTSASTPSRSVGDNSPNNMPSMPRFNSYQSPLFSLRSWSTAAGFRPNKVSYIKATSLTQRAMGPGVSRVCDNGTIPSRGNTPWETFRPTMPHIAAGIRTDPPVSVPTAQPASPADTATPDPLDEPPGVR